jgi:membrane-bound serine protease (ClpP class)
MVALRRVAALLALGLGALSIAGQAPVAGASDGIGRIHLTGVIDQVNASYIEEALKSAADSHFAAVIIQVDSPGGDLSSMDDMLKAILASPVPVITWVAPEGAGAGSAATFITLAGDVAAMAPSTSIGAAAVVGSGGEDLPTTEATKVTNFYAAKIRQLATTHDRNADWAENAVRKASSVGAAEAVAMKPPVVDILAANEIELLAAIDKGTRSDGFGYKHDGQPLP